MKKLQKVIMIFFITTLIAYFWIYFSKDKSSSLNYSNDVSIVKTVTVNLSKSKDNMYQNTKTLQNEIDKLSDFGGGTIILPAGTYYFGQGGTSNAGEKYAIRLRNNVHIIGAGTNENNSNNLTILKPYYQNRNTVGSMDMFYFNNYRDTNLNINGNVSIQTKRNITFKNMDNSTTTLKNQTVYLINADFSNFIIDAENVNGGKYDSTGKGFMINLFKDCNWNNIIVKNTDATGFGVDCPINSSITNSIAINCGKQATTNDGGASGFGIGTGYSPNESFSITNSVAINNKKFGFFFEHQARFGNDNINAYYPATTSKGFVVSNCTAGGNMYDFGGLKAFDVTYRNVRSISGQASYKHYKTYNLRGNVQPFYFSLYSSNVQVKNSFVDTKISDITTNSTEINWAINNGILPLKNSKSFNPTAKVTRIDTIKALYQYKHRPISITNTSDNKTRKNALQSIQKYGFTDLNSSNYQNDLDAVIWGVNKGIISKNSNFYPTMNCTRAQFITMLYRLAGSPKVSYNIPFKDVHSSDWFYSAVVWGYRKGIIKGTGNNLFSPNNDLTKQEIAIFLYRLDSPSQYSTSSTGANIKLGGNNQNNSLSTTPSSPSNNNTSSKPSNPSNNNTSSKPSNPSDNNTSSKPSNPSDNNTSSKPSNSSDNNTSSKPSNPSDNNTSSKPSNPSDNNTSSKPSNPSDNNTSSKPSNPSDNNTSSKPSNSSDNNTSTSTDDSLEIEENDTNESYFFYIIPIIGIISWFILNKLQKRY